MKHHPADISISPSSVTAADTIKMIFSSHGLVFLSQATGFIYTKLDQPNILISFIHCVDRNVKRVTNASPVAHKNKLVRCSPHAPGFQLEQKAKSLLLFSTNQVVQFISRGGIGCFYFSKNLLLLFLLLYDFKILVKRK